MFFSFFFNLISTLRCFWTCYDLKQKSYPVELNNWLKFLRSCTACQYFMIDLWYYKIWTFIKISRQQSRSIISPATIECTYTRVYVCNSCAQNSQRDFFWRKSKKWKITYFCDSYFCKVTFKWKICTSYPALCLSTIFTWMRVYNIFSTKNCFLCSYVSS